MVFNPIISAILLLLLSHSLALPLPISTTLRVGENPTPINGTIHDFIFKGQSTAPDNALDSDNSDYDLLRLLFSYSKSEDILLKAADSENGFTLFAPNDEALTQTARDIREIFQLADTAIPTVEEAAWDVFMAWFDTMDDPLPFVTRILKYHIIVDRELTLTDLQELDDPKLNTSSGEVILFSGISLKNGDERFEDPELIMDCHFTMDDGVMHPIDRLAFPDPDHLVTDTDYVPPVEKATPSATPSNPEEQSPDEQSASGGESASTTSTTESPPGAPATSSTAASDSSADDESSDAACFPASSILHLKDGSTIKMSHLSAGHNVITTTSLSQSSPVYLFTHRQHEIMHDFIRISTDKRQITLTPGHYLYVNGRKVAAERVKIGDTVDTIDGESIVISIAKVREKGLFAPHTLHGDLLVNGIRASSYTTAVSPTLAHMLLSPLRMLVRTGLAIEPLGGLLYNGSPRFAAILPSGNDVY